jgi:hypothetical protein
VVCQSLRALPRYLKALLHATAVYATGQRPLRIRVPAEDASLAALKVDFRGRHEWSARFRLYRRRPEPAPDQRTPAIAARRQVQEQFPVTSTPLKNVDLHQRPAVNLLIHASQGSPQISFFFLSSLLFPYALIELWV